ncbi:MAG: Lrp/AsnC family transcriptional regulator, partial [Candidatus Dadabacteria bacterium]
MLPHEPVELSAPQRLVLNRLQDGIAPTPRPFAALAEEAGVSEQVIVDWICEWLDQGVLTRFGPMIHLDRAGGAVELCALAAPQDEYE